MLKLVKPQKNLGAHPVVVAEAGWYEWYAEGIAIQANADIAADLFYVKVHEKMMLNGYFACTIGKRNGTTGFARSMYGGAVTPSLPTSGCGQLDLPQGWFPYG